MLNTLINPQKDIPSIVIEKTHITPEMLKDKPTIDKIINIFHNFVKDYTIVGHNINFDISFIKKAYNTYLGINYNPNTICTLQLSRKLLKQLKSHKLFVVADHLGINYNKDVLHRAKNDVMLNYKVFIKLMEIWQANNFINI